METERWPRSTRYTWPGSYQCSGTWPGLVNNGICTGIVAVDRLFRSYVPQADAMLGTTVQLSSTVPGPGIILVPVPGTCEVRRVHSTSN